MTDVNIEDVVKPTPRLLELWRMYFANKAAMLGLVLWLLIIFTAVFGPVIYPSDPFEMVGAPLTPPGSEFLMGTDYLGRDILAGILHGASVTLIFGFSATLCSVFIGLTIGVLAGYYGGWVENFLMRVTEFFQVLPGLLLAMVLVTMFSPKMIIVVFAIGVVSWAPLARLTRAEFLKIKEREYVMAEKALGSTNRRIMWLVILPNALPPLIVATVLGIGASILFEAALSFLGLSDPNAYSWGYMIGSSLEYIWDSWWAVTFPGVAIFLTVLGISLIGDGLNDALNPKLRKL
ncbi:MAG: ABC transporter permease [Deltaproteobacteria bacterium]|nr:ABC transporter permease [Deltaproteobacteria bacterium]MBW2175604.1 ABC transporter permease [Deltaproteobacteria bacterium]MBW2298086.1 ABC transporter permease [Deltaproteobacteria bacterium]MBW2677873.1 ABC transporter permease [Deltaproteobacteria bacterium]